LTQGLRAAQQQWPSAIQQAISQNSGSLAESESDGDRVVNNSAITARIARHMDICLNAFAFINSAHRRRKRKMSVALCKDAAYPEAWRRVNESAYPRRAFAMSPGTIFIRPKT
jgi:hypothetical protein